jgi:hypothetical protein
MLTREHRDLIVELHRAFQDFHLEFLEQLAQDPRSEVPGDPRMILRDALALLALAAERSLHPVLGPFFESAEEAAPLLNHITTYMIRLSQPLAGEVLNSARSRLTLYSLEAARHSLADLLHRILRHPPINEAVRRWVRGSDRRREDSWRAEGVSEYRLRAGALRVGDIAGPFQVVRIHISGTYLIAVDLRRDQGQGLPLYSECHNVRPPFRCFTINAWYQQLTLILADQRIAGRMREIPALQFAYGFAEGLGNQVRDIIDLFRNFRQILDSLWRTLSQHSPGEVARAALQQLIDQVMRWGRSFATAEGPRQARMAGRLLGAIVFEIITEIASAGGAAMVGAVQRVNSVLGRARRGLGALAEVVRRIGGISPRVLARATVDRLSTAARGLIQRTGLLLRNTADLLARSFIVGQALLRVGADLVRGTIRRVVSSAAAQHAWIFVSEAGDFVLALTSRLDVPVRARSLGTLAMMPIEDPRLLLRMGALLAPVFSPIITRGLLRTIPEDLSARIARRIVDLDLTPEMARRTLVAAIRRRRAFGRRLSGANETLEAIWEQELRIARNPNSLHSVAALGELDSLQAFSRHASLRPREQGLRLIPDQRSHVPLEHHTVEGVARYDRPPDHLEGFGAVERIEVRTLVGAAPTEAELPARIGRSLVNKLRAGQLGTPLRLRPGGSDVPTWGTIIMNVPDSFPRLTRAVVELMVPDVLVNVLSRGELARVLVRQGDTWIELIREGRQAGAGRVLVREVGSTADWFYYPPRGG